MAKIPSTDRTIVPEGVGGSDLRFLSKKIDYPHSSSNSNGKKIANGKP
jgi:hypothetical protein